MLTASPASPLPEARLAVEVEGLAKVFGSPSAPVEALRGISLAVQSGQRVALLGKSGSGKSTLLNLIGGLDRPTSGSIRVAGKELSRMTANELAEYRLATVGMIFQAYNLIPTRTAIENVELPMILAGRSPPDRRAAARQALEAVGLGRRILHRPVELSGGEHQRVAIARALVNRPEILLADEPTGNLDSATAGEIMRLLLDHVQRDGTTLFLVTHDEELARQSAERIIHMRDGQIIP
jgi:ABC-type lipoprotein export system ATPase subunit